MQRREVEYTYQLESTLAALRNGGILLASTRTDGRSNAMTIGWAAPGIVWGLPVMIVLVRPSRYTYSFIEESKVFTVNVPSADMADFVDLCGTRSGRDVDKLAQVETSMGQKVSCVRIEACPLVYECRVVHWNDVQPDVLSPDVRSKAYPRGDFHRLYYGHILGTFAK